MECQGSLCERHVCVCKRIKWFQTTLPLTNSCKFLSSAVWAAKALWSLPRTWAPESCPDISAGTSPPADRLRFGVLMCRIRWSLHGRSFRRSNSGLPRHHRSSLTMDLGQFLQLLLVFATGWFVGRHQKACVAWVQVQAFYCLPLPSSFTL